MSTHQSPKPGRTPVADVLSAYLWTPGATCYRCGRSDVETATVGQVTPMPGAVDVPACPSCVLVLERERESTARRYGWPYRPGTPCEHH